MLAELRRNLNEFHEIQALAKERLESLGQTLASSKKVISSLGEIMAFLSLRIVKPASRYWPVIFPLLQFLWRQRKKKKGKEKTYGREQKL